ncbi:hypothetical protein [Paenibacillus lemnae]|uniref:CbiN domain protein n=1 Tax=Paenibacillus lemnae TaxID=1330551 RepID=A0A848M9P0_PAELE|nr:hypothetical protein [Paenibacillus lemnae]NMO97958.1 hypothetical protein [Paenibacillus lemnae]
MRKTMMIILTLLMLVPMQPASDIYALSCVEIPSTEDAYDKYDAVIHGRVEKVTRRKDHYEVKVTVIKSFKEIQNQQITMKDDITWGAVRGPEDIGKEYLLFLNKQEDQWVLPLCAPTMNISDAAEELAFLSEKEDPLTSEDPDEETEPAVSSSGGGDTGSPSVMQQENGGEQHVWILMAVISMSLAVLIAVLGMEYRAKIRRDRGIS